MNRIKATAPIKGIAFDMGDTLLETSSLMHAGAIHAAKNLFDEKVISDIDKLINAFFVMDKRANFPYISHLFSHVQIVQQAIETSDTLNDCKMSSLTVACLFLTYYRDKIRQEIHPRKKLFDLFSRLKHKGFKLGIISNGSLQDQIEVLARLKIISYFDSILVSEEVNIEKPDPKIFTLSAKQLGLEASHILFVGDNWETDIVGALKAGFQASLCIEFRSTDLEKAINCSSCTILNKVEDVIGLLT